MYLWSEKISVTATYRQVGISEKSVIDCFSFFRELCSLYFQAYPIKLGGPGIVVQIDESCFSHKPKHHHGRSPNEPIWVFGIVDTSTKPAFGYMQIVHSRDSATLLPIIEKVVQPRSIIYSDQWKVYRSIQSSREIEHHRVNHSLHFVDPTTGVNTQTVESYWNKHKIRIKAMLGCKREFLDSYLQEFIWRERFTNNTFENLGSIMKLQYPLK